MPLRIDDADAIAATLRLITLLATPPPAAARYAILLR